MTQSTITIIVMKKMVYMLKIHRFLNEFPARCPITCSVLTLYGIVITLTWKIISDCNQSAYSAASALPFYLFGLLALPVGFALTVGAFIGEFDKYKRVEAIEQKSRPLSYLFLGFLLIGLYPITIALYKLLFYLWIR